jgi:hypothetical protein
VEGSSTLSSDPAGVLTLLSGIGIVLVDDAHSFTETIWEKQIDVYLDGKECTLTGD